MARRKLSLEVTNCILEENGEVLISPSRGKGILAIMLGLPIALVMPGMLIIDRRISFGSLFCLALGGALIYVGVRALLASKILVDVDNRLVRVDRGSSSSPVQTWPFDALRNEGPVDVTITEIGFSFVRANLHFDESSLLLFETADKKKAQEVVNWLQAAFAK